MKRWRPDLALQRLLEAMEDEILSASEDELHEALTGRSPLSEAAGIRRISEAAIADEGAWDAPSPCDGAPNGRDRRSDWRH